MENTIHSDELQHWGIKGMKWGQRRFQNKDGSLTPAGQKRYNQEVERLKKETAKVKAAEKVVANRKKTQAKIDKLEDKKRALEERKKVLKDGESDKKSDDGSDKKAGETPEERRERLLKSTDAKELYENRSMLTTQELNDRINRIDTEARLQSKIVQEHQMTGREHVDNLRNNIDKAVSLYRSVDNAYSTVANSAIGKTLAKKLGLEPPKKEFNLAETWKNRNKLSTQEMMDLNKRLTAEDAIKKKIEDRDAADKAEQAAKKAEKDARNAAKKAEKEAKKAKQQVDDYNERWAKGESDDKVSSEYETNAGRGQRESSRILGIEQKPDRAPDDGKVYGEGTSRSSIKESMDNGKKWWDTSGVSDTVDYTQTNVRNGEQFLTIAGQVIPLLEYTGR